MNQLFAKIQRYTILRSIAYILLGVAIFLRPRFVFNGIIYIIAAYVAFFGLLHLYSAYREKQRSGYVNLQLVSGILLLIASVGILLFSRVILASIPFFLGVTIIISGCLRLMRSINQKKTGGSYIAGLIFSVLLIIAGIIFAFNPFRTWLVFFQIFGSILVIMGISEIFNYNQQKKRL